MRVYRVVQEALTNVLKHVGPTTAAVSISSARRTLVVSVTNEAGDDFRPNKEMTPGHGLIGMRERAKIYGGSVTAGPRALGGFEVRLTLPAPTTSDRPGGLPSPGTGDVPIR
ncbi:sensor histidine kinase [Streptomyces virginiae]|uniref:sensor histidine kinase n=1 Tax=Streptomyces virginiae TaxID=1961 RepID=UPI00368CAEE7